jgi:hypothetical protein
MALEPPLEPSGGPASCGRLAVERVRRIERSFKFASEKADDGGVVELPIRCDRAS